MLKIHETHIVEVVGAPVQHIKLEVPSSYTFAAGQYLHVVADDNLQIPLSIASAPHTLPQLELHYRSTPGLPEAQAMDTLLKQPTLCITDATGAVHSGAPEQPLLVVAGGTGSAQAFSCAKHRAHLKHCAPTTILWCADHEEDLYSCEELSNYATLIIKIDDQRTQDNEGLTWLREHGLTFKDAHVVLAGSPGFVYAATDQLLALGFDQSSLSADVYAYAPRPAT